MGLIGGLDLPELILILFIILLLFGSNKLPELAKAMGKAVREFKKAMEGEPPKKKPRKSKKSG